MLASPELGGQLRSLPEDAVIIGGSAYVPVDGNFVPQEMRKFIQMLNNGDPGFGHHGPEQAAVVHFAMVSFMSAQFCLE
jgi:hypothetical protein